MRRNYSAYLLPLIIGIEGGIGIEKKWNALPHGFDPDTDPDSDPDSEPNPATAFVSPE
ncbi:hypothetical protein JCM31598_36820 [Desulfonatronum parangueonense]